MESPTQPCPVMRSIEIKQEATDVATTATYPLAAPGETPFVVTTSDVLPRQTWNCRWVRPGCFSRELVLLIAAAPLWFPSRLPWKGKAQARGIIAPIRPDSVNAFLLSFPKGRSQAFIPRIEFSFHRGQRALLLYPAIRLNALIVHAVLHRYPFAKAGGQNAECFAERESFR